jgi:hypothetical protein
VEVHGTQQVAWKKIGRLERDWTKDEVGNAGGDHPIVVEKVK